MSPPAKLPDGDPARTATFYNLPPAARTPEKPLQYTNSDVKISIALFVCSRVRARRRGPSIVAAHATILPDSERAPLRRNRPIELILQPLPLLARLRSPRRGRLEAPLAGASQEYPRPPLRPTSHRPRARGPRGRTSDLISAAAISPCFPGRAAFPRSLNAACPRDIPRALTLAHRTDRSSRTRLAAGSAGNIKW